jgi:hypothetical protein
LFYKHFKKPCSFRIYLDDVMVDEVVLNKDINPIKDFKKKYVNESTRWFYRRLIQRPPSEKIWIYHLDLKDTSKNIFLEFNINDSNYSNGFMSQSALVKIRCAGLIKESIFNKSKNVKKDILEKLKKKFSYIKEDRVVDLAEFEETVSDNDVPEPALDIDDEFSWPSVNRFLAQIKNGSAMEEKELIYEWCSGNFLVKLNLIKKHKNMILQDCYRPVKGPVAFDAYIIWLKQLPEVINTYNEDK